MKVSIKKIKWKIRQEKNKEEMVKVEKWQSGRLEPKYIGNYIKSKCIKYPQFNDNTVVLNIYKTQLYTDTYTQRYRYYNTDTLSIKWEKMFSANISQKQGRMTKKI